MYSFRSRTTARSGRFKEGLCAASSPAPLEALAPRAHQALEGAPFLTYHLLCGVRRTSVGNSTFWIFKTLLFCIWFFSGGGAAGLDSSFDLVVVVVGITKGTAYTLGQRQKQEYVHSTWVGAGVVPIPSCLPLASYLRSPGCCRDPPILTQDSGVQGYITLYYLLDWWTHKAGLLNPPPGP